MAVENWDFMEQRTLYHEALAPHGQNERRKHATSRENYEKANEVTRLVNKLFNQF